MLIKYVVCIASYVMCGGSLFLFVSSLFCEVVEDSKHGNTGWISGQERSVCLEYDEPKFRTKNCIGIVTPHICSHSFVHSLPMSLFEDLRE